MTTPLEAIQHERDRQEREDLEELLAITPSEMVAAIMHAISSNYFDDEIVTALYAARLRLLPQPPNPTHGGPTTSWVPANLI